MLLGVTKKWGSEVICSLIPMGESNVHPFNMFQRIISNTCQSVFRVESRPTMIYDVRVPCRTKIQNNIRYTIYDIRNTKYKILRYIYIYIYIYI